MGLQDLLQRILFVFGIGFLIANLVVIADLVRFRIRKRSALLVWQGEKPRFYGFSLALGVMLGLPGICIAEDVVWRAVTPDSPPPPAIVAPGPPPSKMGWPVSPSTPCRRLLPSAPTLHTMASARPSVVVTIGEPRPPPMAHQATLRDGEAPAPIRIAVKSPAWPSGHPIPRPLKTT